MRMISKTDKMILQFIKNEEVVLVASKFNGIDAMTISKVTKKDEEVSLRPLAIIIDAEMFKLLENPLEEVEK